MARNINRNSLARMVIKVAKVVSKGDTRDINRMGRRTKEIKGDTGGKAYGN